MKYTFGILILGLVFLGNFEARVNHTSQYFTMETNTEPVEIRLQEDIEENNFNILVELNKRIQKLEAKVINEEENMKTIKDILEEKIPVQEIEEQLRTLNSEYNEFYAENAEVENGDKDHYGGLENN